MALVECSFLNVLSDMRWKRSGAYPELGNSDKNVIYDMLNKSAMMNRHSSVQALKTSQFVEDIKAKLWKYSSGFGDFGLS